MNRADIRFVILALCILQSPRHRQSLIRMAMGRPLSPTIPAPSSRTGEALGQGMTDPKQNAVPLWRFQPSGGSVVARACSREFQNTLLHSL